MLWRKVIVGNFGEEPSEWCSWVAREGYGVSLWKSIRKAEKKIATIHNVFAVIRGSEEPDRYVLLGNHRDAWTYGAVDPNSGTAVLLDIARRYALMMRQGGNLGGQLFYAVGMQKSLGCCIYHHHQFLLSLPELLYALAHLFVLKIGSTEWVEQNLLNLGSKVVAYLNVDCAVQGPGFFAGATPQLDNLLIEVAKKVQDPDSESMTIYDNWMITNKVINIQRLSGVDSDFAPLLQHAGVPSVDLYYGRDFPVYHTAFDSYNWMTNHGDPLFQRHVAVAGVWGLLALHLADDPILPFNYVSYTEQLWNYTNLLRNLGERYCIPAPYNCIHSGTHLCRPKKLREKHLAVPMANLTRNNEDDSGRPFDGCKAARFCNS
ncbi:putative glutamate carboxypeptidase PLA3 [Vitis vinifera]|uniref:Putative glutamate carboxypeptidase PLA3 n=1 Tax=Vitis vinifera TaxID=29760 RepID=A0A438BMQ5_VITVI|nr:putative glutamate carboxypeptidase PLA3 [Vitis vinifera]